MRKWQQDWINATIQKEIQPDMRVYSKKSNLAFDINLLTEDKLLKKDDDQYYPLVKVKIPYIHISPIEMMKDFIMDYLEEEIIERNEIYYFNFEQSQRKDNRKEFTELHESIVRARKEMRDRWFEWQLRKIATAFQRELKKMTSMSDRIRLWKDLETHVGIQMLNLGFREEDFTELLKPIFKPDINATQDEVAQVVRETKKQKKRFRAIEEQISMVMWTEGFHSPLAAFEFIMQNQWTSLPECEQNEIHEHLSEMKKHSDMMDRLGLTILHRIPHIYF